ncbi:rod shape-determining protein RodA [Marihabitans asiaticum]|uniref:peptidoglycan glycosyltransferase n=1 Tax=Marihabitans asiaticum TaxID=415218 RepID=A0A560W9W1_9MICO|nr:FtsW/RodA/SpoVE family cell cycle protein [Marihabitans asiaticum]TWD14408.1 rod shape determining protein RodA [Marihabitans asiaticum]
MVLVAQATPPRRDRGMARRLLRSDLILLVTALTLSLLGAVLVRSATAPGSGSTYLVKHLVNLAIALVMAGLLLRLDRLALRAVAPAAYLLSLAALAAVLSPLGSTVNGSRSWIVLPVGFSVQPAELAKVALCVALPMVLVGAAERRRAPRAREVLLAGVVVGLPVLLVLAQPDLGSALVLVALGVGVLAASGARWPWLVGVGLGAVSAVVAAFTTPVLSQYQRDRLTVFLDPAADPLGIGYQTQQVLAAISSGGLLGAGLGQGEITQSGRIPYQETDFVFSVAAEELGFVGALMVIVLYGLLIARLGLAAARSDHFGRLVCVGVATWFSVQVVENVGMNLGLMPVTGLPLPFLSYGGSSMFACWLGIALAVGVGSYHRSDTNPRGG